MKIGYLGAGAWGFALASLLAKNGHEVILWTIFPELVERLNSGKEHPSLKGFCAPKGLRLTTDLKQAVNGVDLLVESVTSAGLRDVLNQVKHIQAPTCPVVLTSKGIENDTGLTLTDVAEQVLGNGVKIGSLSGPSFAVDVVQGLPTSVVAASAQQEVMEMIVSVFANETFRVYTNPDIKGVSYGGALKNIIAIACGITEGLGFGMSARAALMTRGLHEMTKLALAAGGQKETLYGLSGMGDLCLTCNSTTSRNFQYGILLAQGASSDEAKKKIGMAVEGAYTAKSALQLSKRLGIAMPITEAVYNIVYQGKDPMSCARALMTRPLKDEF
jgi:glycerol-3-phosphate dehydrogenase (NAD(P)+)